MQSAQKHTFINAKNLQGSKFFRPFKYFLAQHSTAQHSTAQHSLKQLFFSLLLCCVLFSFAQEDNATTFYVNPNTAIVGLDNLNQNTKLAKLEKKHPKLYIVENTIFYSSHDLAIVTIKDNDDIYTASQSKKIKSFINVVKTNKQVVKAQSKTQVAQAPFPFSLPTEQKQTIVAVVSTTTITPSAVSKTVSKAFTIHNTFPLSFQKALTQKQNTIYYNINSKSFQIKLKHCNRPPPAIYC